MFIKGARRGGPPIKQNFGPPSGSFGARNRPLKKDPGGFFKPESQNFYMAKEFIKYKL